MNLQNTNPIIGECGKHPGQSMLNCHCCYLESLKQTNNQEIPTAEELLSNNLDGLMELISDDDISHFYKGVVCEFAKEFARQHVQEALKQASENAVTFIPSHPHLHNVKAVNRISILNAYPPINIK